MTSEKEQNDIEKHIQNVNNWPELGPAETLENKLYLVEVKEAHLAMVTVHKKDNFFLYYEDKGGKNFAFQITDAQFSWENNYSNIFLESEREEMRQFLINGKEKGYSAILLQGYGPEHDLIRDLWVTYNDYVSKREEIEELTTKTNSMISDIQKRKESIISKYIS